MLPSKNDFADNKSEIEQYFNFLKAIENGGVNLHNASISVFRIDTELINILKATTFLLLYNLIESTVRNILWDIHQIIKSDTTVLYSNLQHDLKKVLIGRKVSADFRTTDDTITNQVFSIIETTFNSYSELHPVKKEDIKIDGGNLNMDKLRDAFKKYGINSGLQERSTQQKEAFKDTKTNRNLLAHGDKTFNNCGKDFSFIELEEKKNFIFDFLENKVFVVAEDFINQDRYKVTP
ncbi:MAE_28990/MAE_18760 family HEPN-like nuclease [Emticicia fontis]